MKHDDAISALGFRVRPAKAADQPEIKRVVYAVLEEFGIGLDPCGEQDDDLDDLAAWYPPPRGIFEVIEDNGGTILGCGGVHPIDDKICELRKLYFLPALRGRGLGGLMLDRFVDFAKAREYRRMVLETASVLHAAISLYERRGFREVPGRPGISRCDRAFALALDEYVPPN